jgi:hypothetical protein
VRRQVARQLTLVQYLVWRLLLRQPSAGLRAGSVDSSGLGHGAAWGKKVVDEGKLKMRARK